MKATKRTGKLGIVRLSAAQRDLVKRLLANAPVAKRK